MAYTDSARCAACDAPLAGRFCAACGERRPSSDDERLGPFLREQWQEATSADGKLWATAKALFVPGKLTEEFFAGRRSRYVRPVRIFLVSNILFFLVLSSGGANSDVQGRAATHQGALFYGTWAQAELVNAAADADVAPEVYAAAFDRRSVTLAGSLIGLMVPLFAGVLAVVLFRRRTSGVRHLVFATHYIAFTMAGSIAVALPWLLLITLVRRLGWVAPDSWLLLMTDPVTFIVLLVYLTFALRRVYALTWPDTAWATAILAVAGMPLVFTAYRFALFVVALWTTEVPV